MDAFFVRISLEFTQKIGEFYAQNFIHKIACSLRLILIKTKLMQFSTILLAI